MKRAKRDRLIDAARNVSAVLEKNQNVLGIFLFGSTVAGDIHVGSDIDLGIVWGGPEKERPSRHTEEKFGEKVEFLYLHPKQIEWMFSVGHGGCVDWFRTCEILYDPKSLIRKWKRVAEDFRWTEGQIGEQLNTCLNYLNTSKKALEENDNHTAIVAVREASVSLARAFLMRENNPKHLDLADLLSQLKSYPHLKEIFFEIHFGNVEWKSEEIVEEMHELDAYATSLRRETDVSRFRRSFRDFDMHIRHVQEGLWRKNTESALLHLRLAAHLLLGVLAEEYRGEPVDWLERIKIARYCRNEFYKIYARVHGMKEIERTEIEMYRRALYSNSKELAIKSRG